MRHVVSTGVLALGLMATTYAQAPAPVPVPANPATAQQPTTRPEPKPVVLTGCVGGGPAAFTLTNAMAATTPAKPGESPVGTAGIASSYDLTPRAGVDLAAHVGHKVEITGAPAELNVSNPGVPAAERPAAGADVAAKAPAPKLTVTALKMVSATCS